MTILLFSMAGVPPLLGFFSKLLVFVNNINNSFALLYPLLFLVLFLGLYFYIQNIRFLHSTNYQTLNYTYLNTDRTILLYNYFSIWIVILLLGGFVIINDIDLYCTWLFF